MTEIKDKSPFKLTHPDKILYAEDKITKLALMEYYENVQDWILPHIINRPLTLVRCPDGYQNCFYQKHLPQHETSGLFGISIQEKEKKETYIYIKNVKGLLSLVQMGTLEIHPWGSQIKRVEHPDIIIFDLDPAEDVPWKKIVSAAFEIKKHLAEFKLRSFIKTTGGKGLHVVIPIKPKYDWEEIKNFAHVFADFMALQKPNEYLIKMIKAQRKGKIFIDYLRNQRGATAIAPYSTRARLHAPVAVPIDWDELTHDIRDTSFTIQTLPRRLQHLKKDPWKNFYTLKQSLNLEKFR